MGRVDESNVRLAPDLGTPRGIYFKGWVCGLDLDSGVRAPFARGWRHSYWISNWSGVMNIWGLFCEGNAGGETGRVSA